MACFIWEIWAKCGDSRRARLRVDNHQRPVTHETTHRPKSRIGSHLCAWLLFLGGFVMLGAAVLVPSWHTARQLAVQCSVLRHQAEHMAAQEEAYDRFHKALVQRHPVLLQRLAFHHLSLKPVGALVLNETIDGPSDCATASPCAADEALPGDASVGTWLHKPLPPRAGQINGPIGAPDGPLPVHPLSKLAFGPGRVSLMVCGVLAMVIGLLIPFDGKSRKSQVV